MVSNIMDQGANLDALMSEIADLRSQINRHPLLRWAFIVTTSPLTIRFEEDSEALVGTPSTLMSSHRVGQKVRVAVQLGSITIIGPAKGIGSPDIVTGLLHYNYIGFDDTLVTLDGGATYQAATWLTEYDPSGGREVSLINHGDGYGIVGQFVTQKKLPIAHPFYQYNETNFTGIWVDNANATKLSSGLVVLSGLLYHTGAPANAALVTTLPPGYRPPYVQKVHYLIANTIRCLDIYPNGEVRLANSGLPANSFISLDGISFYPAGVGTWTTVGTPGSGTSFGPGYRQHPSVATYGPVEYYKDPYGMVWWRGLIEIQKATPVDNDVMIVIPAALGSAFGQQHIPTTGNNVMSIIGANATAINWKAGSVGGIGSWISMSTAYRTVGAPPMSRSWQPPLFANSWANYGSGFPVAEIFRRGDGLCYSSGLLITGSIGARMFNMPQHYRSREADKIFAAFSQGTESRILVPGNRVTTAAELGGLTAQAGAPNFFSLDGIRWLPN